MYTSYIGKKFLRLYNQQTGTDLSARTFFDEIFFPLFFDDPRHLLHVGNSAFFQKPSRDMLKDGLTVSQAQLQKLHLDIEHEPPSMATFVGYGAKDMTGTTSGQMTNLDPGIDAEEMYASWIGQAFGIGVSGGYVMLLAEDQVLLDLFEGWQLYRNYLAQTPNIKGNQIETWNGQWICHRYSRNYDPEYPDEFELDIADVQGKLSIPTVEWTRVIFALSRKFGTHDRILTAYGYNLSQTNTTLGFVNIYLAAANSMHEVRDRLFVDRESSILTTTEIESILPFFNFRSACMQGTIGLKTLEPRGLRKYMPKGTFMYAQGKDFQFSDQDSFTTFYLFKIWIIAMINKAELLDLAAGLARSLIQHEEGMKQEGRGKTGASNKVKEILEAKSIRSFIDHITTIMDASNAGLLKALVEQLLKMPSDIFPLFVTLVRFEYQFQHHQS